MTLPACQSLTQYYPDQVLSVVFGEGSHIWKVGLPLYCYKDFSTFLATITDNSLFPGRMILAGEEGNNLHHLMHGASLPQTNTT